MGQKVNPIGLRLGVNKTWQSKWYVDPREYADTLHEDLVLRKALLACPEVAGAEISEVEITRKPQRITMIIATARPGVIIGAKGANVEKIAEKMQKLTDKKVQIKIREIKKAECDAQLIAQNIAKQLEGRGAYRRAMKNAISRALQGGVEGIKIKCSGRLGGAAIARTEQMKDGRVPLHTLRSDIDYGFATANTSFGSIGITVWVFTGEIYDRGATVEDESTATVGRKKAEEARG